MRRHRNLIRSTSERFTSPKVYNTGVDPLGSWKEFIRNDTVLNIDVHRDLKKPVQLPPLNCDKPAIGCTKTIRKTVPDKPKVEYVISTDRISFAKPESSMKRNIVTPARDFAEKGWEVRAQPPSFINCQSTKYDIINFQENPNAVVRKTAQIDARRLKGISEFEDLANSSQNPQYRQQLEADPRVHLRKTGIFTHLYDAAARHGYITSPFETNQSAGGKPAFKC